MLCISLTIVRSLSPPLLTHRVTYCCMDNKQHIQTDASSDEAEQNLVYDVFLDELISKEEVEGIERAYQGQVEQWLYYHNG